MTRMKDSRALDGLPLAVRRALGKPAGVSVEGVVGSRSNTLEASLLGEGANSM